MKLIIDKLSKSYGKKQILDQIEYTFEAGNIYGIIGRNGAGKTTLFECLMGRTKVSSGTISRVEENINYALDFNDISMVSATPSLPDFLTGYEFIKSYIDIHKNNIKSVKAIDDYFDMISLDRSSRHSLIKTYSYGMKNKVQLLTCLIRESKIILLDEPLTSFDVIVSHDIKTMLLDLKENNIIILTTHILKLAEDICDEIIVLKDGSIKSIDQNMKLDMSIINVLREKVQ